MTLSENTNPDTVHTFAVGDRVRTWGTPAGDTPVGTVRHINRDDGIAYFVEWDDGFGPDRGGYNGTIESSLNLWHLEER